jgi:hypothetical protein
MLLCFCIRFYITLFVMKQFLYFKHIILLGYSLTNLHFIPNYASQFGNFMGFSFLELVITSGFLFLMQLRFIYS